MILDTNALSAFADGDKKLLPIIENEPGLAVPVIVLGEYLYGVHQSRFRERYERWLDTSVGSTPTCTCSICWSSASKRPGATRNFGGS